MNAPHDTDTADDDDGFAADEVDGRLKISGDVDALSAPRLAEAIAAHEGDVALDMSETDFIDSSGIRVLIEHHQLRTDAGQSFRIVQPSRAVLRTLELSSLDTYFNIS